MDARAQAQITAVALLLLGAGVARAQPGDRCHESSVESATGGSGAVASTQVVLPDATKPTKTDKELAADLGPGRRMRFSVGHHFSREQARERVRQLLDYWGTRFGVSNHWLGDCARITGKVMGISIDALLIVSDQSVGGEALDPGMFTRRAAYDYIRGKLRKYLHPNYEE